MFLSHDAVVTASLSGRLLCITITKTVCMAGDDQSREKVGPHNFQILTLQQKCLLLQQGCSPELVSMQYAWYHDCRGVQKESLRFPKKLMLKNTVASGGADVANLLHRLQQLVCYPSTFTTISLMLKEGSECLFLPACCPNGVPRS